MFHLLKKTKSKPTPSLPTPSDILAELIVQRILLDDPSIKKIPDPDPTRPVSIYSDHHTYYSWGENKIWIVKTYLDQISVKLVHPHKSNKPDIIFSKKASKDLKEAFDQRSKTLADQKAAQLKKDQELAACDLIQETIDGTMQLT